ncbi:MAG: 1-acyl-sn-glycerol-3-phosphate acyltransferase [Treponema sp.]|nr:1-acyl-sn-glycerol-3-phosphate acyltransferase [Treponema sp.]
MDLSVWFRLASALAYYAVIPVAVLINFVQHLTGYKHLRRLKGIRRAVTVSNHTTFLDPVKVSCLALPGLMFQTLLEATVEPPYLGTFTRLLGGVPIPRGKRGYRSLLESCRKGFRYRRFLHFYPEGECFLYNQRIRPFRIGAFRLAAELGVPVVPLVTVFSPGPFPPRSLLGRSLPTETMVVLEPIPPADHVRRDESGEITAESLKDFAEFVRGRMQAEIDRRGGTQAFFRGQMGRLKGLNDA